MSEDKKAADFSRRELLEGATLGLRTPRLPRWTGFKRQKELAGKTLAFGQLDGLELFLATAVHSARCSHSSDTFRHHQVKQTNFAAKTAEKAGRALSLLSIVVRGLQRLPEAAREQRCDASHSS